MLKERVKIRIRPSHLLAVLFLVFIFYVGCAALPQFLIRSGNNLQWHEGLRNFIRQTNELYSGMLEADNQYPLLHNKGTYINLNGFMAGQMRQPMMNDRIKLKNGHLAQENDEVPEPEEIRQAAENIIRFHDTQIASGGKFLFVMAPGQISKYEQLLPPGYINTGNDTADAFLAYLQEAGVPFLDLREEMQKENISVTDAFYTTDHHWTPQTSLWAFGKILDKLTGIQAIDPVDPLYTDPANYTMVTYEDTFLGSSGRRTGRYYAGLDDSVFLKPDFETDISIHVPERELSLQGPYETVCYNTEADHDLQNPNFFLENSYGLYGWGDTKITHWRNARAPEQGKFLLIGDSFGNIPFSLMSIACGSCDEVDLRYYDGDFTAYYRDYRPDTVILEVTVGLTLSEFTSFAYPG